MTTTAGSRRRRPTMADVAERAGVSRTLVSFILAGKPGAGEETQLRVLAVAEELGYRPDSVARMLARGRSRTLGVLVDMSQLFQSELVTHMYPAAEALNHDVLLTANLPERSEVSSLERLIDHRCGALIVLGPHTDGAELLPVAARAPMVVVGRTLTEDVLHAGAVATVRTDDHLGMAQAVDYLVGLGHRDILHVDGGDGPGAGDRTLGYRTAMQRHGLSEHIAIVAGAHREDAGARAARELLGRSRLPTAILAGNDRCALGLLDVFTRAGVDVPGDISLVGYDDSLLSDNPRIDLTTIHQDATGMATTAVDLAVAMLTDQSDGGDDVVLEPSLKVRGTTAPPREQR
ncbi:LacI family DNA-binding transcriptional regulator [Gordonia polyisoprenivorans]|uniref:LacI family transcriptional regulator n=1 Tax=Gordonia polyisoprenivorans TaxID=84595 RepID=A0A846WMB8_9ACTN|nr:LacI family DNA-binding transcriptional regulator [Gordonia polyisoprenivorans]MBE7191623.1 LacI family DNA-binding transcriptional regulator [Gordonia polyisoprenivorans]NKY01930.1 LacI family transcriptional regulator [Gordonia polyisoprenivorans]OZC31508.1 LacI family transcriptional regulator [Gordonia polyisoprenivorans]UZF54865.1 LacI family transcriptional regulator [Gordonia polyisoprenivorans]